MMSWSKNFGREIDPYKGAEDALHDDCVPRNETFQYVVENEWESVEDRVREQAADGWITATRAYLQCLNIVCEHDKEHVRESIRRGLEPGREEISQILEHRLLAVATDVARFLESLPQSSRQECDRGASDDFCRRQAKAPVLRLSEYAASCRVSDDLRWAERLIRTTRILRELLFGIALPLRDTTIAGDVVGSLRDLNALIRSAPSKPVVFIEGSKRTPIFAREADTAQHPIEALFADWIADYLTTHRSAIDLAVCSECGRIFQRERKDNLYCSKTCQNRVAYKRKRVFESGLLKPVAVDPDAPDQLREGLWLHHNRCGLGIVKRVSYSDRRVRVRYVDGSTFTFRAPKEKALLSHGKEVVAEDEVVDPRSVLVIVQFLAVARQFAYHEIFPAKRTENVPTLYAAEDLSSLLDLL